MIEGIDNSWIKLPRSFTSWRWYEDTNMVQLYMYLLLSANLEDRTRKGISIKRGEYIGSLSKMIEDTGLTMRNLRTCLANLQKTHEIKYKKLKKGQIIILVDFNKFQPIGIDETNPNWIKLYRHIRDWQWFQHPSMVHILVHIMLKGAPEVQANGKLLWQFSTSYRTLSSETGISIRTIRTCIEKLKKSGEIGVSFFPTHQISVITLSDYDSYEAANTQADTMLTQYRHKKELVCDTPVIGEVTHLNGDVNVCDYDSYEAANTQADTMLTQYRHDTDMILGEKPTQYRHDTDTKVTTLKEYKKERIKESSSSFSHVRARENFDFSESEQKENEQKKVEKESFYDLMKQNGHWLDAMSKKFHVDVVQIAAKVDEFKLDLICRGRDEHPTLQNCMSHFNDWLEINVRMSKRNIQETSPLKTKERWEGELFVPKSSEGGVYEGRF